MNVLAEICRYGLFKELLYILRNHINFHVHRISEKPAKDLC